ncbi:DUF1449 domain-containing protein [Anabaena sp. UHCC 0451]|uniref:DUF1449 domain-containing protein n=1 Tax=Anabaena sp. UHCC 0451 TaxID=2055235 RepID=UPI002B1F9898|nr:DUF1449 domain-containing protein [Anabaena sp. UHCC 0451]MEA5575662.1 DUF1449 domain-containing protein [Anabaena sp. UHCC 0451]
MLFSPANLPYWIFLITGILLFLFMILMGGGEAELDADADLDVETDSDVSFGNFLGWAGIGKAPLLLLLATDLSLWGVIGWMLNVWIGDIAANQQINLTGITILFISLIISLFMGRLIAEPIGKMFAEFSEDASSDRLVGCIGNVNSVYIPAENLGKIGQVDILDPKGNFLTINAVIPDWATIAPQRGEKVIVIELKQQIYLVIAKDSVDEEHWLNSSNSKN